MLIWAPKLQKNIEIEECFTIKSKKEMLKHEFEDRIGRKVSDAEYEEANAMYETSGEMDKDAFCREWRKIGNYSLVKNLFEAASDRGMHLEEHKLMVNEQQRMLSRVVDELVTNIILLQEWYIEGATVDDFKKMMECLQETAVNAMGQKYVIRQKLRKGACLTEEEVELVEKAL